MCNVVNRNKLLIPTKNFKYGIKVIEMLGRKVRINEAETQEKKKQQKFKIKIQQLNRSNGYKLRDDMEIDNGV